MTTKKPDIWMPLYVADYLADTAYLSTEQHGAYLLMLMAYWRNGPIPDDDRILASITRMTPDALSIARAVLEQFFTIEDGRWVNKRIEQEYDRANRNRAVAHDRAAKAAAARWGKDAPSIPQALPEDMLVQCPSPSPSPSPKSSGSKDSSAGADVSPPGEDEAAAAKPDPVPYGAIIDLYHRTLPMLRKCRGLSNKRKSHIRARWKNDIDQLDDWQRYFKDVAKSDFLCGRVQPSPGRRVFFADIDFLIREDVLLNVQEGKYDNGRGK